MGPVRDTVDGASPPIDDVLRNEWKRCVVEWVENSCRVQGVSTKITDVAILGQVAVLLVAGRQPALVRLAKVLPNDLDQTVYGPSPLD